MREKKTKERKSYSQRWNPATVVITVVSLFTLLVILAIGNRATYLTILVFLALLLIHNYLLYPLFREKKYKFYIPLVLVLLLLLLGFTLWTHDPHHKRIAPPMENVTDLPFPDVPAEDRDFPDGENFFDFGGPPPHERGPFGPEVSAFFLGVLLLACNLAGRSWLDAMEREKRYAKMAEENLSQQLAYLRYQINPHFFMNTLNNIHALVDIDPELAKSSIVELSRLMRYLLYEGNKPTIPLGKEIEFIRHYIALMRLRYADSVEISFRATGVGGESEVPPLLFATFIENAFKHGVSYETASFIRVFIRAKDGRVAFHCTNSLATLNTDPDPEHGIGLQNIRKRLDLLYETNYNISVKETGKEYQIRLDIPSTCKFLETV